MPNCFLPELVAPIIRFMYTGRLDFKSHLVTRLRETACTLEIAVLTKLLDAQINAPVTNAETPHNNQSNSGGNQKQKARNDLDPVRQIKRIKKIEKKFERELRQEKLKPKDKQLAPTSETNQIVPGKKLPI